MNEKFKDKPKQQRKEVKIVVKESELKIAGMGEELANVIARRIEDTYFYWEVKARVQHKTYSTDPLRLDYIILVSCQKNMLDEINGFALGYCRAYNEGKVMA